MTVATDTATTTAPDPRIRALAVRKRIALALLGAAALGLVGCVVGERLHPHPAWELGATMMEAALVGGLADWFAVVALFRHPLGQRWIPHTAIIPKRKDAIGRSLADFICNHFLGTEQVIHRLEAFDAAGRIARQLERPESAQRIAHLLTQAAPRLLRMLESPELHRFMHEATRSRMGAIDVSRLTAAALEHLTAEGRHEELVDVALAYVRDALASPETRAMIERRVSDEVWGIVRFVRLDGIVVERVTDKLIDGTTTLVGEMAEDRQHETRVRIAGEFRRLIERLRTDEGLRLKVEATRDQLLAQPELAQYLKSLWTDLVDWVERDAASPDSRMQAQIAAGAREVGRRLLADDAMRASINDAVRGGVEPLIHEYRGKIREFIIERIQAWSADELTDELELSVGVDLQYIRYNGTVVGGLIGAILWGLTVGIERLMA